MKKCYVSSRNLFFHKHHMNFVSNLKAKRGVLPSLETVRIEVASLYSPWQVKKKKKKSIYGRELTWPSFQSCHETHKTVT